MRADTVAALDRINRRFYSLRGREFDRTRRRPWPGWERLAAALGDAPSILDAGCGNGRLGFFLGRRLEGRLSYLGLDTSRELLARAREAAAREADADRDGSYLFRELDLFESGALERAAPGRFDLVAAFGLIHHVAGATRRRDLLRRLAGRVAPGGFLAVSFWQFGSRPRFLRRSLAPGLWRARTGESIDPADLEAGDHLLIWGEPSEAGAPVRYCHWTDPDEAERLTSGLGLELRQSYLADGAGGDLNLYRLLARPGGHSSRSRPE